MRLPPPSRVLCRAGVARFTHSRKKRFFEASLNRWLTDLGTHPRNRHNPIMLNPLDLIRNLCARLDPALVERHLRRMPASYFERYAAADIARHLRLLAGLGPAEPVAVEARPLGGPVYEIVVGCANLSGAVACVTTALAADGFDLEDMQIAIYDESPDAAAEPCLTLIHLRVTGPDETGPAADLGPALRDRLRPVFTHL